MYSYVINCLGLKWASNHGKNMSKMWLDAQETEWIVWFLQAPGYFWNSESYVSCCGVVSQMNSNWRSREKMYRRGASTGMKKRMTVKLYPMRFVCTRSCLARFTIYNSHHEIVCSWQCAIIHHRFGLNRQSDWRIVLCSIWSFWDKRCQRNQLKKA